MPIDESMFQLDQFAFKTQTDISEDPTISKDIGQNHETK